MFTSVKDNDFYRDLFLQGLRGVHAVTEGGILDVLHNNGKHVGCDAILHTLLDLLGVVLIRDLVGLLGVTQSWVIC